jgi:shikimate dehydrogenase/3-dehydroquinate dehydratase type I
MNGPIPPEIIVTLPAHRLDEAVVQMREAREDGADLAELRVDLLPAEEQDALASLFPAPLPLVATYRSRREGGEGAEEAGPRQVQLARLAALPFAYVDFEAGRDLPLSRELASLLARPGAPRMIISSHLPTGSSPARLRRALLEHADPRHVTKVIVPAELTTLLHDLLPVLPVPFPSPTVVHTTGSSGGLLRAWAARFGMSHVYAAPGRARGRTAVEPSQIECDRLRRFFRGKGEPLLFALVGHPVHHSRSPEIHERWMEALGCRGLYLLVDAAQPAELVAAVPVLASQGFRGINVTHPLKRAALETASVVRPAAERAGCANLLTFRGDEVEAENTDVTAVLRRLRELRTKRANGSGRVTVIGAGGAARAALVALEVLGEPVEVVARDPTAAGALAREFGAQVRDATTGPTSDLVIHATPAGRAEVPSLEIDLDRLVGSGSYVLDFVYEPHHRFLAEWCARHGADYEDGRTLLVYQAAECFEDWWGTPVPTGELRSALRGSP